MITFEDFKKVEISVGKILSAEKIEGSEKLLKLLVDFGEKKREEAAVEPAAVAAGESSTPQQRDIRQILSGIQKYFPDESVLVGRKCMFVTNLEPRQMMGLVSNGMLFALGGHDGVPFSLITPETDVPEGTLAN